MKNHHCVDSELLKRAINGDRDAFGDIYLLLLDEIYRYIFYHIGEVEDAEDLTEKVFLSAWKALPVYTDQGCPFTSWIYRIAHNTTVDYLRSRERNRAIPIDDELEEVIRCDSSSLQDLNLEEAGALAKAIAKLPDDQRQVIVLRFIEGFSHAEIANILDKSEGASRMLQNRALIALSRLLEVA